MQSHHTETKVTRGDSALTCDELREKIDELEAKKAELQSELVGPPPANGAAKWTLLRAISAVNMQLAYCGGRYADQCGPPRPQPLSTALDGDGSIHTNAVLIQHDPPKAPVSMELLFDASRRTVVLSGFEPIVYKLVFVNNVVDIATVMLFQNGQGSYATDSGVLSLPVRLQVTHTSPVPNADAVLTLGTHGKAAGVVGSPLDKTTRRVALAGNGKFEGLLPPLGGASCDLGIEGRLRDLP